MAGLVPAIHVFQRVRRLPAAHVRECRQGALANGKVQDSKKDVDLRVSPRQDRGLSARRPGDDE